MDTPYKKLKGLYKDRALLEMIRFNLKDTKLRMAAKIGISFELYECLIKDEISSEVLTESSKNSIESLVNAYFGTFKLNRRDAAEMFELSTGMTKMFFLNQFNISERTWYNYLMGENIQNAIDIDKFLLIL